MDDDITRVPTANELYFSGLPAGVDEVEILERYFFANIRLKNGTFKRTYSHRLDDLNDLVLGFIPPDRPLKVMDVAVSSGISTLEWMNHLQQAGIEHHMTAGDIALKASLVSIGKNLRVLVDSTGYPLQFDIRGKSIPNPPGGTNLARYGLELLAIKSVLALGVRGFGISDTPIDLVSPRLVRPSNLRLVEDDILRTTGFQKSFHVLRAANILNRYYFTDGQLVDILARLRSRLMPGGIFLVCRTNERRKNHGTIFVLNDAGRFEVLARIGDGSAIEDLVVDAAPPRKLNYVKMIQGRDIICFANDWDSDSLSKKHIMLRLAEYNRVLWVNSIGNRKPTASVHDVKRIAKKVFDFTRGHRWVQEQIYVFSPIALPFLGSRFARRINQKVLKWSLRRVCRRLGFEKPIAWTFYPAPASVVGSLGEAKIIYHCGDEYSEFSGTDKDAMIQLERELMTKCDCVIVSSERLYQAKKPYNKNTFLVTHGVDVAHFRKACDPHISVPEEMKRLRRPLIGYFGLIADWVDLDLIRFLALSRPAYSFVLIGKVTTDVKVFDGVGNVHLLGQRSYETLPGYVKAFDVAILPLVMNELTIAANPLKLREYLAAGLPVVSTAIPEAARLNHIVRIGHSKFEFLNHVSAILESGPTGPQMSISSHVDSESLDRKVEQLSQIVGGIRGNA
jgi:glycosyltransferase involved in cell wall biosynthesis